MKRILRLFMVCLILSTGYSSSFAQNFPLPDNFTFDGHSDMRNYTRYIIPCINWLQQTPLNEYKEERARVNSFVLSWLQINPDISIGLPEYSYKLHDINDQLLYIFMEGWIKYTLETKDTDLTNCRIAGLHSMLDYYVTGKAAELGKNEFLDNLLIIEKDGKLRELFDTSHSAKNTWLYLNTHQKKRILSMMRIISTSIFIVSIFYIRET
jgi:hypothetical protein